MDLSALLNLEQELTPRAKAAMQQAAQHLATQTHAHILERSQSQLHSTRAKYANALGFYQENPHTWVVSLDASAMWIEAGFSKREMLDDLLKSPKAKTARDGSRFVVVPFDQNKAPTQSTQAQQDLTATVKSELKKRKIPYGKLEKDKDGNVKTGVLHRFDVMTKPIKTQNAPGMGAGPIGAVRQGPTGIPFLQGIQVSQRANKMADGGTKYSRHITTFRVASSKHKGTGRWVHPGLQARNFFEEAFDWSKMTFEQQMVPQILEELATRL
jgi:hypothetical protein